MERFRVVRSDWSDDPKHPCPGWNPVAPYAKWLDPPGDWFLDVPSPSWLAVQGQRMLCDLTIRASLADGEPHELIVTPWADVHAMLGIPKSKAPRAT
jgi:hypothetical protein